MKTCEQASHASVPPYLRTNAAVTYRRRSVPVEASPLLQASARWEVQPSRTQQPEEVSYLRSRAVICNDFSTVRFERAQVPLGSASLQPTRRKVSSVQHLFEPQCLLSSRMVRLIWPVWCQCSTLSDSLPSPSSLIHSWACPSPLHSILPAPLSPSTRTLQCCTYLCSFRKLCVSREM